MLTAATSDSEGARSGKLRGSGCGKQLLPEDAMRVRKAAKGRVTSSELAWAQLHPFVNACKCLFSFFDKYSGQGL